MRRGQGVPQCYRKKKRNGMVTLPVVAVSGSWSRSRCDGEGGGGGGGGGDRTDCSPLAGMT